jgi:hypothetical protein
MAAGHIFIIGCLVGPLDKSRGVTHPLLAAATRVRARLLDARSLTLASATRLEFSCRAMAIERIAIAFRALLAATGNAEQWDRVRSCSIA